MYLGLLFALLSSVCFGIMAVLAKLSYADGLDGLGLQQIRYTLAVPIMALMLGVWKPRLLLPSKSVLLKAVIMGGVLCGIQCPTYFIGVETIPASSASLIVSFYPVTTALLAAYFLGQRIDLATGTAIGLVLAGCALVFLDAFSRPIELKGALLVVISTLTYSVYLVFGQVALRNENPLRATFWVIVMTAVSLNLLAGPGRWSGYDLNDIYWGAVFGLVCSVLGISFLYLALEKVGSAHVAIFASLDPVIGVTGAALVLGEKVVAWQIAGMFLIVTGIILPNLGHLLARRRAVLSPTGDGQL